MSAIAGICHFTDEPINLEHGRRLMKKLEKFPADDVQTWHSDNVFLGCHAQWITPESIGEKLPYYDHNRKMAITADAIIDNREELFEKLQVKKADQKTISDSELILLSYDKWGEDCPKYLVGDFAFMIWDAREQKMFGARDFSGARTLYYYENKKIFSFCTVINPLLSLPGVKKELNEEWLAQFLALTAPVDAVDTSITPYEAIMQVPPAHAISIMKGKVKLVRYCYLSSEKTLKLNSNEEYVEAFQEVFQQAVNSRLRTFRGIGSQLSGGLDSGSIASFAVKALNGNKKLHTFSYIPPKDFVDFTPKYLLPDERPFIKMTVDHVGGIIDHYLDLEGKNSFSDIDDILEILEMPYKFFQNSFWIKGIFEEAKEQGIGVILSGARGNLSISWGPALDYYGLLLKKLQWVRLVRELNCYSQNVGGPRLRRLPMIAKTAFPYFGTSKDLFQEPPLINREFAKKTRVYETLKEYGIDQTGWLSSPNAYEQRLRHFRDVFHWNTSNTFLSKLSLRYGLQVRDPSNDLRVVRICLAIPEEQYVQNGMDRALIRRATENYLPGKVRLNQRYRGTQGADWIHRMVPHWKTFICDAQQLNKDLRYLKYVNGEAVKTALKKVEEGAKTDHVTDPYYKILMHSVILYRFIKKFF